MQINIQDLLFKVSSQLAKYLEIILPKIEENWWGNLVIKSLSYKQKEQLQRSKTNSLIILDLAALLRIIDNNWYQISQIENVSQVERHYVKEMQTIRNKWAHITSAGYSDDDIYRDLDTLKRFALVIKAEDSFIELIETEKKKLLSFSSKDTDSNIKIEQNKKDEIFKVGDIICLKSEPETQGAIISVEKETPENRYNVFIGNSMQMLYESQIKPITKIETDIYFSKKEVDAYLTSVQIQHPSISNLYSLNAARIDFIPYQFRPVLKFIQSDRPRLLIADSVGVGKTIEAGLILRELQARSEINSVLIICPRALVVEKKWENEMKRFDEKFIPLDSKSLQHCVNEMDIEDTWPRQFSKVIMSYSLFSEELLFGSNDKRYKKKGLLSLDPPVKFDLVIVDEAHYIRNKTTIRHKIVRYFCDNSESVIFLTATPIQMGNKDLFTLLNVLRSDLIIDKESFKAMSEPNHFINEAIQKVRKAKVNWQSETLNSIYEMEETFFGKMILSKSPSVIDIKHKLTEIVLTAEDRVRLISELEEIHTFSSLINRTRRRDIGNFTIRKPKTVEVEFTDSQRNFYNNLLNIQADIYEMIHENINLNFLMTNIRRRATSCLFGLIPYLKEILTRNIDFHFDENNQECETDFDYSIIDIIKEDIENLIEEAKLIDTLDPKIIKLKKILLEKQSMSNNKVMIFSSFRHTLSYIKGKLEFDNYRFGIIHGGIKDDERINFRNRFELPKEDKNSLDILLFSDVGSEGLDYQFCDCLINYDLPWNPMKIEQRIGRIDRNGQQSENIAIYNMITPNTIDAKIYERCLLRIGIFNSSVGHNEEILGEITREIKNVAEDFNLSEKEKDEKLQQIADNKIRLLTEQEKLEQKQFELFGIRIPQEKIKKDIEQASSYWLSQSSIRNLIELYFAKKNGENQDNILGEKELKTIRSSQEMRNLLLEDLNNISIKKSQLYKKWLDWLKGNQAHFPITFDSNFAMKNRDISFIMPLHPLVKQAAAVLGKEKKRIVTMLSVKDNVLEPDNYPFIVYVWHYKGLRNDLKITTISISNKISSQLNFLLKKATSLNTEQKISFEQSDWDKLNKNHYNQWNKAKEKHKENTIRLVNYRKVSLNLSYKARISQLKDQLENTTNEKIIRMRKSQIDSVEADYARRNQELDIAIERTDLTAQAIVYGVINVKGKK